MATGLRRLGCEVTQMSAGSLWMQVERQIDMSRSPGRLGGARLYWRMRYGDLSRMLRGYDVVAMHDLNFAELKPVRLRPLFDRLRRDNGAVFLSAMSTDVAYLDMLGAVDSPLRYSEWFVDGRPSRMQAANPEQWQQWHDEKLVDYQHYVLDRLDGAVSVLYEYDLAMRRALGDDRVAYGGIPIDTSLFDPVEIPENLDRVKIFLGRDRLRKLMKGSDLLEAAARAVVERHPDKASLEIVENRPYAEFVGLLRNSHLVLDQIYSYTPATMALMAMAYGQSVVSGGEPEFYDFIGERSLRPIINAPIELDGLTRAIESVVVDPSSFARRGRESRLFVERHNDCEVVARRFLNFWMSKL
ncbi:MAG: hypothetical protein K2G08_07260 [Paramuribaculum sp.]|nr:hypothetical protein [Paramuribaculum sp.]